MAEERGALVEAPPPPPTAAPAAEAQQLAAAEAPVGKQTPVALAVREALAKAPNPAALLYRDPGAPVPLTSLQAESVAGWTGGVVANYAPTTQLVRIHNKEELAAAREQARRELAGEVERARPDATDPKGLAEAWAAMGFEAVRPAPYRPIGARPAFQGQVPTADADALFAAHVASQLCADCRSPGGCYGGAICNLVQGVVWPWGPRGPPPKAAAPPPAQKYDPNITALVHKRLAQGALLPATPEDIDYYGRVFNAPRELPTLAPEELAGIAVEGDAGAEAALEAAMARRDVFIEAMKGRAGGKAWAAGRAATLTSIAERLVVDLSGWKEYTLRLSFRYDSLEPLLTFLSELHAAGERAAVAAIDLLSGYTQLPLSREARRVTGIVVTMETGGAASYFVHGRVPQGAGPSCAIFSLYTGMLKEICLARLRRDSLRARLSTYLDDFLPAMFGPHAAAVLAAFKALCAEVRATPNAAKSSDEPEDERQMLGIVVTASPPAVAQPAAGIVRLLMFTLVLERCAEKSIAVPRSALEQLAGHVAWVGCTEPSVPAHTRDLARCTGLARGHRLWKWGTDRAKKVAADIRWLAQRGRDGLRGERVLPCVRDAPSLFLISDATAGKGGGDANGVALLCETAAMRWELPDCGGIIVPALEALPILLFLMLVGDAVRGANIVWGTDASTVAYWVAKRKVNNSDPGNDLMRLLCAAEDALDVRVTAKWVTRWHNYAADRGATEPWHAVAARGLAIPARREQTTLSGLPCEFLKNFAQRISPGFSFSTDEWAVVHPRS